MVSSGETVTLLTLTQNDPHQHNSVLDIRSSSPPIILHRIIESRIHVDTIYFDEAHNSVKKQVFSIVEVSQLLIGVISSPIR